MNTKLEKGNGILGDALAKAATMSKAEEEQVKLGHCPKCSTARPVLMRAMLEMPTMRSWQCNRCSTVYMVDRKVIPDPVIPEASESEKGISTEKTLTENVDRWLSTWAPHCGASKDVFEGQWRATLEGIFDEIERRAEANMLRTGKLEGMHYAALKEIREELKVPRASQPLSDNESE